MDEEFEAIMFTVCSDVYYLGLFSHAFLDLDHTSITFGQGRVFDTFVNDFVLFEDSCGIAACSHFQLQALHSIEQEREFIKIAANTFFVPGKTVKVIRR
jgi:hypothetical protein